MGWKPVTILECLFPLLFSILVVQNLSSTSPGMEYEDFGGNCLWLRRFMSNDG